MQRDLDSLFIKKDFAFRLREVRLASNARPTKKEMAGFLGVRPSTYGEWENPEKSATPDLSMFTRICSILESWPLYLLTGRYETYKDRQHSSGIEQFYSRYSADPSFNYVIRQLASMDDAAIEAIETLISLR